MNTQHQAGDVISDRYRIVAPLGQGGMGTTYEAEDLTNYQPVALKALSLRQIREWKVLELFEREARVLANLEHPAIPKYLDYFPIETPDNRRFYLVRELVSGESLADLVEKGWHADESEVKRIAVQVLDILNYLHQLTPPVIHRDIKPQNIIRSPDGRVFLVDFGAVQEVYRNTLTRGGTFVGTLGSLFGSLWNFAGRIRLQIDKQNFQLQWVIWGLTLRQIQGQTRDIERIKRVDIKYKNTTESRVIFWEGVRQHRFTLGSSQEDKWLADEASDFLLQLRYGKRSQP